jgi:hypothetical protein
MEQKGILERENGVGGFTGWRVRTARVSILLED